MFELNNIICSCLSIHKRLQMFMDIYVNASTHRVFEREQCGLDYLCNPHYKSSFVITYVAKRFNFPSMESPYSIL